MNVLCPWHHSLYERLLKQQEAQRLPHALLIGGVSGIGKYRLARVIAESVLCSQPEQGMACGRCHSCHLMMAGSHPDFVEVEPEASSKVIKIDQIRSLVGLCAHTAQYSGYRVVLIHPAETMNQAAANALLKTLEEPGEKTLILLLSHAPSRLLPTVRSRCQQWNLPLPGSADAVSWLAHYVGGEDKAVELLAVAQGAPLKALALQNEEWFHDRVKFLNALGMWAVGKKGLVESAGVFKPYEPEQMLWLLWNWAGQIARVASGGEASNEDPATLGHIKALAARKPLAAWLRFAQKAQELRQLLLAGANPQKELIFEQLLLELNPSSSQIT